MIQNQKPRVTFSSFQKKNRRRKPENRFELTSTRGVGPSPSVRRKQQTPGSTFRPGTSIGNRHRHDNDDDDYYCQLLSSLTRHTIKTREKDRGDGEPYTTTHQVQRHVVYYSPALSHTPSSTAHSWRRQRKK